MDIKEKNKGKFISSIDLLNRANISRATLNNYINAGILPRPIIKKPYDTTYSKAKRIGYFPDFVLDTLNRIIQYKKKGHSMEEICKNLKRKSIGSPINDQINSRMTTSVKIRPSNRISESGELFYPQDNRSGDVPAENPTQGVERFPSTKERDVQGLFKHNLSVSHSFSVLAADLQDSLKICAEMSPEEYLKLINQIWTCAKSSFKKYAGIYGKHPGIGLVYYFLKSQSSNYLMNSIYCSLELRDKMKELSDKWKHSKGWYKDLYLNVGINEGCEFFGKISASPTLEFITLGDTANYALRLSDFARCGSIWTTKNLLTRLNDKERKKIRYGIRHGQLANDVLIENTFSRIADLIPHDRDNKHLMFSDISAVTVTEIHNLH